MLNPLRELTAIAQDAEVPVCVDAVSSAGGVPINMDELGIAVLATVSSKCLAAPPGLTLVAVGERGWNVMDKSGPPNHGWSQDLRVWREYDERWGDFHPSPTSMPTGLVLALGAALLRIARTGIGEHMAVMARAARRVREELARLGFKTMVTRDHSSPMVTAVSARPEFEISDLIGYLAREHDLIVAGGIGPLRGKMLRIGHMGKAATVQYATALLDAVRQFLGDRALV
jgi:aspartate aminotransferase-like enzyme